MIFGVKLNATPIPDYQECVSAMPETRMSTRTQIIARHVAGLAFRDLPASAVDATLRNLLDTVGVAIAAAAARANALAEAFRGVESLPDGRALTAALG